MRAPRRPHHSPVIPFRRRSQQAEVIALIGGWPNDSAVSRSRGNCRQFIQKILAILTQGGNHFEQRAQPGRPRKLTGEILARIVESSNHDSRLSDSLLAAIPSDAVPSAGSRRCERRVYPILNDKENKQFKVATFWKIMFQNKLFHFTKINISIASKKPCKVEQLIWVNVRTIEIRPLCSASL
jgi:hypothetical protein